jgi:hypothetical protein
MPSYRAPTDVVIKFLRHRFDTLSVINVSNTPFSVMQVSHHSVGYPMPNNDNTRNRRLGYSRLTRRSTVRLTSRAPPPCLSL